MENDTTISNQRGLIQSRKIFNQICVQARKQNNLFDSLFNKYLLKFFDTFLEDLYLKMIDSKLDENMYLLISILLIEIINGIFSLAFLIKFKVYIYFPTKFFLILGVKICALIFHILEFFQSNLSCLPKWIWSIFSFLGIAVGDCLLFYNLLMLGSELSNLSNLLTFGIGIQYFCCIHLHIRNFMLCLLIFIITYIIMILISFCSIIIECISN